MQFLPACVVCGKPAASIEVIPPRALPTDWASWDEPRRQAFTRYRDAESHQLIYSGPGGSSGREGNAITPQRAAAITTAFSHTHTPTAEEIAATDLYDRAGLCVTCGAFYCPAHWSISSTGYGTCPRGHGKSLDPHWQPDFDFPDDDDTDADD